MGISLKPFFIKLGLFSITVLGLLFLFQHYASARFQSPLFWIIWLFFVVSTAIIHAVLIKTAATDPKKFINYFMGITGMKLFAYLIVIILFGLLDRENAGGFIVCFLMCYFFFSVFEVISLLKHFKK